MPPSATRSGRGLARGDLIGGVLDRTPRFVAGPWTVVVTIDAVHPIAVLVHAVAERFGGTGIGQRVGVVAVVAVRDSIAVGVGVLLHPGLHAALVDDQHVELAVGRGVLLLAALGAVRVELGKWQTCTRHRPG